MIRLVIIVVGAAGVFSFLAFQQGGYLAGVLLAVFAVAVLGFAVVSGSRRRGNAGAAVPWSPQAKKAIAGVAVLLLIGVGYSAYWFWSPKASTEALDGVYDLRDLCDSQQKYFPDAAAYTGAAPHPVVAFAAQDSVGLDQVDVDYSAPAQWYPKEARDVQLVACFGDVESGPKITDCRFTDGSVPMYQGRYTGSLFEARTGKKVASISVDGVTGPDCPTSVLTQGDDPRIHSMPDLAALRGSLGRYVEG